jgi:hypothetical protein
MRRVLLLVAVAAMVCVPAAGAWTWPTNGEILQSFVFDPAHPYAAGEHRGIDVAGPAGADVLAPRAGTVTFAGAVPGSGLSVAILTEDGYSVTLTHLGSIAVPRGSTVAEGSLVGSVGSSGSVHLGVRVAAQAQGYVDPATLLPARTTHLPPASPAPQAPAAPVQPAAPPAAAPAPAPVAAPAPALAVVAPEPAPAAPVEAPPAPTSAPVPVAAPALVIQPAQASPLPAQGAALRIVASPRRAATVSPPAVASTPVAVPVAHHAPARHTSAPAKWKAPVADPVAEIAAPRGYAAMGAFAPPVAHVVRRVVVRETSHVAVPTVALIAVAASLLLTGLWRGARIIGRRVDDETEDPCSAGLALRGWAPAPRPRRRVRAVRRVRALPPLAGQRRPGGEWHRRAWDADHGRGRRGGEAIR